MNQQDLSKLSDERLIEEAEKIRPSPKVDAFFIGFLVGIIVFSIAVSTWGLVTVIPLFLIYLLLKKSKTEKAINEELEERGLR